MTRRANWLLVFWLIGITGAVAGADLQLQIVLTNGEVRIEFTPYPAAESYTIESAADAAEPFAPDLSGTLLGFRWQGPTTNQRLFRVQATQMDSNALLTATVLNRLAYGQTPDELERVRSIGPQAYISEQLAPWAITETAEQTSPDLEFIGLMMARPDEVVTEFHTSYSDLVAWHTLRAVYAKRQLLEIMLQFVENHFVTRHGKSYAYLFDLYTDPPCTYCAMVRQIATQFEYTENKRWRDALLQPQCTFYDLLRISAESPAMILYLDTVLNGANSRIANENYARELLELFTYGVDNGYDQDDIEAMAPAWMGWRADLVAPEDYTNVFATPLVGADDSYTNHTGVWVFNYSESFHRQTNSKVIFTNKTVPVRFGEAWARRGYQLDLPERDGRNGIQDGYDVIAHLANQPFTMEYISIKLCRLLVHDGFPNPATHSDFYDYTRTNLSAEAQLVHDCMTAWDSSEPKGQIWTVAATIVNSELFRSQRANQQKVKTPLEFCASAVRALMADVGSGELSAGMDGYGIERALTDQGKMLLFDRGAPDGYPETAAAWVSAGGLSARIRFVQSMCLSNGHPDKLIAGFGTRVSPVRLLIAKLPAASLNDTAAVAAYLLQIIYPGEGAANLALYRDLVMARLNKGTLEAPPSSTPFNELTVSAEAGSPYDIRVRAAVALLLSLQPFSEQ
ncbi:MAG TPA: DUF1800 family protein [Verrucomicrobiae bacterium]|nr:DUF1800 family protein [Verrucomicrobiae bacterium]